MQQQPPAIDLRPWFIVLDELEPVANWADYFGNDNPVHLDIGCGRGLFLTNSSEAHPDVNYLGMEVDYREGRRTAKKLKRSEQPNARVWGGDAKYALRKLAPEASVERAYVLFPDPWWKKRHRKRRLFDEEFIELMCRVLIPGGELHSHTDVPEYFEVIRSLMHHHPRFEFLYTPEESEPKHDMDYLTGFERKARRKGTGISRGVWRFVG
ncbi:tRNA (guanine-N(7)-)-methyltransferase [Calycomorphotria hydatis]|uniref:tRNA (guanine-N(7)-)-methyltransferase n=2 Tax=Calycomorphotria hydatis TaxID=2528027 RepID=A0A517TDE2_9PLAN|nr:tRNA (guanine-N(7)-)-methyltransferase [Calycomorphotria hydatis]